MPLYRAVEDLLFKFLIGGYSNNVVFAEYLRELSRAYKEQGKVKEIVSKITMTAACFSKFMSILMGVHQSRSARGAEDTREIFNSVYFSLLFQKCRNPDGTFREPLEAIGLTYERLNIILGGLTDTERTDLSSTFTQNLNTRIKFDDFFNPNSPKTKEAVSVDFLWGIFIGLDTARSEQLAKDIFAMFILPFVDKLYTKSVNGHRMKYQTILFNLLGGIKIFTEHYIKPYFIVPVLSSLVILLLLKPASTLAFSFFLVSILPLVILWMLKYAIPRNGFIVFLNKHLEGTAQGLFDFVSTQLINSGSDKYIEAAYNNCVDDDSKQKIRKALNHFATYARPLPKSREFITAIFAIALGFGFSNYFGLILLSRLVVFAVFIVVLPAVVSYLAQKVTQHNLRSDKWMISYPAYGFVMVFLFIGFFGLPYIETAFMVYSLWKIALVLFAALSLVALTLTLMPRVTMYLLGWPSVISKRWERRLQFVVIYNKHLKYWAQKVFGIKAGGVKVFPFGQIIIFSSLIIFTYVLFVNVGLLAAVGLGIIAMAYLLGCLNMYVQMKIIQKRFGFHNLIWGKSPEGIAQNMAKAQVYRFIEFLYEDGHLNKRQKDGLLAGKDNGAALADAWDRLKWIANKFYKFDLEEAVFSKEGILWEKLQKLTWHPATFLDPIVYFNFEDGMRYVDLPALLSQDKALRLEGGNPAISHEELNKLKQADRELFLAYYEERDILEEMRWIRKSGMPIRNTDYCLLKELFKGIGIRIPNKSYHSEFNNLVTNTAGTQWDNFLHNIFEVEELGDTLNSILSVELRKHLDSLSNSDEIESVVKAITQDKETKEALLGLLNEKFESEENVAATINKLANFKITIEAREYLLLDMERIKYKMMRMLNMNHASGFRNWEGSKLVSELGYRYLTEQAFFGESKDADDYFELKNKFFSDRQGRRELMRKVLDILESAGVSLERIQVLEGALFRASESWVPLNMLTAAERSILINTQSGITPDPQWADMLVSLSQESIPRRVERASSSIKEMEKEIKRIVEGTLLQKLFSRKRDVIGAILELMHYGGFHESLHISGWRYDGGEKEARTALGKLCKLMNRKDGELLFDALRKRGFYCLELKWEGALEIIASNNGYVDTVIDQLKDGADAWSLTTHLIKTRFRTIKDLDEHIRFFYNGKFSGHRDKYELRRSIYINLLCGETWDYEEAANLLREMGEEGIVILWNLLPKLREQLRFSGFYAAIKALGVIAIELAWSLMPDNKRKLEDIFSDIGPKAASELVRLSGVNKEYELLISKLLEKKMPVLTMLTRTIPIAEDKKRPLAEALQEKIVLENTRLDLGLTDSSHVVAGLIRMAGVNKEYELLISKLLEKRCLF